LNQKLRGTRVQNWGKVRPNCDSRFGDRSHCGHEYPGVGSSEGDRHKKVKTGPYYCHWL